MLHLRDIYRTAWLIGLVVLAAPCVARDEPPAIRIRPQRALLAGKVVPLAEALERQAIKSYSDEIKTQVVLETAGGELVPIVPDWRGRAFYQDARLRDRPVELVVQRRQGVPWAQVLAVYAFDEKGARCLVDYWCDICAIPLYEVKECECCQGPIELRLTPAELPKELEPPRPASPP